MDLIYLGLMFAFFIVSAALVYAFDKLGRRS